MKADIITKAGAAEICTRDKRQRTRIRRYRDAFSNMKRRNRQK